MKKRNLIFIFLIFIFTAIIYSCKKKLVHKTHPEFVGKWKHIENTNETWYIDINERSLGTAILYDSLNNFKHAYGENSHRWRIIESDNLLYFDMFDKFHIDVYPTEATTTIYNGLDTINQGESYMIIDQDYFVKY